MAVAWRAAPYRPAAADGDAVWDARWAAGDLDHLANEVESARSAVLAELLVHIGGEPAILEVGCGTGLFRTRVEGVPFRRYLGVDVSATAIEKASSLADERTSFAVAARPGQQLGRFDVVVANEVLYCPDDPAQVLDDIAGVLAPGGHLLCSNWRHPGDVGLLRLITERFVTVQDVELRSLVAPRHRWRVGHYRLR
ncbi:MAG: class I SAM-dependent DNA methyltransferase [Acidimicrobiales bacterium]